MTLHTKYTSALTFFPPEFLSVPTVSSMGAGGKLDPSKIGIFFQKKNEKNLPILLK